MTINVLEKISSVIFTLIYKLILYLFITGLITYLRNKIRNIEIRYNYQFVNSKTSMDKLLENNNIKGTLMQI